MEFVLNEKTAFHAMSIFLNQYAERVKNDLYTVIGDIAIMQDGLTTDPAAWDEWIEAVERAVSDDGLTGYWAGGEDYV